ncbi:hypothetical protein MANES_04G066760v8 [Manihot esculenta]|uniref:Uncharacterized protein n=1 Tax=Manihot esculenta TaxID=3983 RepID=A0ACB7HTE4_MANES|nr:hypothetical protein MANES_04G066760v8 [Manihot esculenta]
MRIFTFVVFSILFTFLLLSTSEQCGSQAGGALCPAVCLGRCRAGILWRGGGNLDGIYLEKALDKMLSQRPFAYGFRRSRYNVISFHFICKRIN